MITKKLQSLLCKAGIHHYKSMGKIGNQPIWQCRSCHLTTDQKNVVQENTEKRTLGDQKTKQLYANIKT